MKQRARVDRLGCAGRQIQLDQPRLVAFRRALARIAGIVVPRSAVTACDQERQEQPADALHFAPGRSVVSMSVGGLDGVSLVGVGEGAGAGFGAGWAESAGALFPLGL